MSTGKEKYKELVEYTSGVEMELVQIATMYRNHIHAYEQLSKLQSVVDFNVVFIYNIAPEVSLHIKSVEWLNSHSKSFTRKIKLKELLEYDTIIYWHNPKDLIELKNLIKTKK